MENCSGRIPNVMFGHVFQLYASLALKDLNNMIVDVVDDVRIAIRSDQLNRLLGLTIVATVTHHV